MLCEFEPMLCEFEPMLYEFKPMLCEFEPMLYEFKLLFNNIELLLNRDEPLFYTNILFFNALFLLNIFVEKYIRITTIYEDFSGQGRSLTMVPFKRSYAWLKIWGMKNKTSSFFPASLIRGVDVAYDNAFFSGVMFRFISRINLPSSPINFNGVSAPFSDRAESWLSLGI